MNSIPYGWYGQRLEEEQEQLDAVHDALAAVDTDRLASAARRINNTAAARAAERLAACREARDALDILEALEGFLKARVEHLRPLASGERRQELDALKREHAASL